MIMSDLISVISNSIEDLETLVESSPENEALSYCLDDLYEKLDALQGKEFEEASAKYREAKKAMAEAHAEVKEALSDMDKIASAIDKLSGAVNKIVKLIG